MKSIEQHGTVSPLAEWKQLRDEVRLQVETRGYNSEIASYVQHCGTEHLDASVLLLPIVAFTNAKDPRVLSTVSAIERALLRMAWSCEIFSSWLSVINVFG